MKVDSDDPFQILGLEPTVDQKVIKRAYKRMALKYHPDVLAHGKFVCVCVFMCVCVCVPPRKFSGLVANSNLLQRLYTRGEEES